MWYIHFQRITQFPLFNLRPAFCSLWDVSPNYFDSVLYHGCCHDYPSVLVSDTSVETLHATFWVSCKKRWWPTHLVFPFENMVSSQERNLGFERISMASLTYTQPKCCSWDCAPCPQVYLIGSDILCHVVVIVSWKCRADTQFLQVISFSLLEASAPFTDLYVVWSGATHQ